MRTISICIPARADARLRESLPGDRSEACTMRLWIRTLELVLRTLVNAGF